MAAEFAGPIGDLGCMTHCTSANSASLDRPPLAGTNRPTSNTQTNPRGGAKHRGERLRRVQGGHRAATAAGGSQQRHAVIHCLGVPHFRPPYTYAPCAGQAKRLVPPQTVSAMGAASPYPSPSRFCAQRQHKSPQPTGLPTKGDADCPASPPRCCRWPAPPSPRPSSKATLHQWRPKLTKPQSRKR